MRELFDGEGPTLLGLADAVVYEAGEADYREWIWWNFHGSMTYVEYHAAAAGSSATGSGRHSSVTLELRRLLQRRCGQSC